ncbi:hypothetical protein D3C76_1723030 [compost metagenome]
MILRPVRPQSPTGPPMMKLPVGLMWYWVPLCSSSAGRVCLTISSITASCRSFCETSGLCWVDSTTASMPTTLPFS